MTPLPRINKLGVVGAQCRLFRRIRARTGISLPTCDRWAMIRLPRLHPGGADAKHFTGRKVDKTVYEKMSSEQIGQLYELMHATNGVWKDPDPNSNLKSPP
ncbi:hypothetical protein C8F04DRAFT_1173010 [Mycena alexandri]|uniref:Uncharacterized protein n=1 Tax=Mycena alexandri TaxID=1745969 RepID=A0AAD6XFF1_9AGAR|nr:hypothetical protein C8F04DRAFT_1173010 [Mycena alexandri]